MFECQTNFHLLNLGITLYFLHKPIFTFLSVTKQSVVGWFWNGSNVFLLCFRLNRRRTTWLSSTTKRQWSPWRSWAGRTDSLPWSGVSWLEMYLTGEPRPCQSEQSFTICKPFGWCLWSLWSQERRDSKKENPFCYFMLPQQYSDRFLKALAVACPLWVC